MPDGGVAPEGPPDPPDPGRPPDLGGPPDPVKPVVLVGLMGVGKTTVGRIVAKRTGRTFVDTDVAIRARTGKTVRELWEEGGEAAYRRLESQAVIDTVAGHDPGVVLAAAAGAVLDPAVREALATAFVVWLRADPAVLAGRVRPGDHRPLLGEHPGRVLAQMDAERASIYRSVADAVVGSGASGPETVADQVIAVMPS